MYSNIAWTFVPQDIIGVLKIITNVYQLQRPGGYPDTWDYYWEPQGTKFKIILCGASANHVSNDTVSAESNQSL